MVADPTCPGCDVATTPVVAPDDRMASPNHTNGAWVPCTGVTGALATDGSPVPVALVARTTNVYAVPFASSVTVIGEPDPDAVRPPGEAVTV